MVGRNAHIFGIYLGSTRLGDSVLSVTGSGRMPGEMGLP